MLFRDPPRDPEVTDAYARLNARATQGIAAFLNAGAGGALAEEEDSGLALEMFAELLKVAQNGLASWGTSTQRSRARRSSGGCSSSAGPA